MKKAKAKVSKTKYKRNIADMAGRSELAPSRFPKGTVFGSQMKPKLSNQLKKGLQTNYSR